MEVPGTVRKGVGMALGAGCIVGSGRLLLSPSGSSPGTRLVGSGLSPLYKASAKITTAPAAPTVHVQARMLRLGLRKIVLQLRQRHLYIRCSLWRLRMFRLLQCGHRSISRPLYV